MLIVQPLFMTSFLIEHQFRSEHWFDAQNIVISSASSKTAMALAYMVRNESPEIRRIGLTSPSNLLGNTATSVHIGSHYVNLLIALMALLAGVSPFRNRFRLLT